MVDIPLASAASGPIWCLLFMFTFAIEQGLRHDPCIESPVDLSQVYLPISGVIAYFHRGIYISYTGICTGGRVPNINYPCVGEEGSRVHTTKAATEIYIYSREK